MKRLLIGVLMAACFIPAMPAATIVPWVTVQGTQPAVDQDHHMAAVKRNGAEAMGFNQDKTAHHFRLLKSGGMVEVRAKDPSDRATIQAIQHHLKMQRQSFAQGNFDAPQHTHGQVPPGVPTMQELKSQIQYQFRQTAQGGQLRIWSANAKAIEAIHDFLRFQIQDHRTGDRMTVR